MKSTNKPKPVEIHIGAMGGVRVDAEEFFAQQEVQDQIEKMSTMQIVGVVMDSAHMSPKKQKKNSK